MYKTLFCFPSLFPIGCFPPSFRGLGVGVVSAAMSKLGLEVHAVELDPVVAKFAEDYFGLKQRYVRKSLQLSA